MSDTDTRDVTDTSLTTRSPAKHVRGCAVCGLFPHTLCGLPHPSTAPMTDVNISRITCVVCRDLWLDHIDLHGAFSGTP